VSDGAGCSNSLLRLTWSDNQSGAWHPFAEVAVPTYYEVIQRLIPEVEYHQNRYARGLADLVRPGCRWLDVGAGAKLHEGWIGLKAKDLADRAELLVGCDIVETHLAQNRLLGSATVADVMHLPFCDDSFDLVTANMVLEHLEEPRRVFTEIARVLAPGGHFVFVTPNLHNPVVWSASVVLSKSVRKRLAHFLDGRDDEHIFHTFYRANSRPVIQKLSEGLALKVKEIDAFNSYPYIRHFWPLTAVEALWIKAISRGPLKAFTTNLFGVLEKTDRRR
jgi:ubiquinone/menaquinone biosynthesis C-methylase UbiE